MLAVNHATLATATVLGLSLYLNQPFFLPLILFVVFSGVFPDIDHPNSELGKMFKPVARMLPHRGITHSFVGTAIFCGSLYFLLGQSSQWFTYFLIFGAFFGVYLLEKIVHRRVNQMDTFSHNLIGQKQINWMLKIASMVIYGFLFSLLFLVWNDSLRMQILVLLTIGYMAHILGDFVTIEGVPLFYPVKKKVGLKLFRTGSGVESFVGFLIILANLYFLYQLNLRDQFTTTAYWVKYMGMR
jgi:membrane-bound metal-dependent hydrolase YbcI (DUF457 family)